MPQLGRRRRVAFACERAARAPDEIVDALGGRARRSCSAASWSAASRICTIAVATWSAADFCCCVARIDSSSIVGGRAHQLADLARLSRSLLGGHDGRVRLVLDGADDLADRLGRADRALGQLAHLRGDDREALAGVAGAGGLDRSVQREQVRLLCDLVDQLEDLADLLRALAQRERPLGDRLDLLLHVAHRVAGLLGGRRDRAGVVGDRGCGCGQLLDRRGGLRDGSALLGRRRSRLLRGGPQLGRNAAEDAQRRANVSDEALEVPPRAGRSVRRGGERRRQTRRHPARPGVRR